MTEQRRTSTRSLGPNPSLDGLRGLAILAVLATHVVFLDSGSQTWALRGGFLGVDVFLGLSAFLIAAVLLRELDRSAAGGDPPRFDVASFALRRFRRLYPAMTILIVVTGAVAVVLLDRDLVRRVIQSLPALASVSNWQRAWGDPLPFELVHLWSLSLEAQFYVLMAVGFLLARNHLDRPRRLVALMVGGALAVLVWRFWLLEAGVPLAELYERTDTRADSMFLGVAAALVWRSGILSDRVVARLGSVSAVFLACAFALVEVDSRWLYQGGFTLVGAASASVVLAVATGPGVVSSVSALAPLRWVGEISYSLYLWHLPVFVWTVMLIGEERPLALKGAVAIPLSVGLAWASYTVVERRALAPWRRGGVTTATDRRASGSGHRAGEQR